MLCDEKFALPIEVSYTTVPIRGLKKRSETRTQWPVLKLSSWAQYELQNGGEMFLAGHNILQEAAWKSEFRNFWDKYEHIDGSHPVFAIEPTARSTTIPFLLHGDEGRGRGKLPILTISCQCLLSHYGSHRLNMSGSFGCNMAGSLD